MSNDITVPNNHIAMGIDTISGLTKMQQGFSRLIKNLNLNSAGWVQKRKGFQVRSGVVPIKIQDTIYDEEQDITEVVFDPTMALSSVNDGPISIVNKDLSTNMYVDINRWKVVANKEMDSNTVSFSTVTAGTSFCNYVIRDQTEGVDEVAQILGGRLEYSASSQEAPIIRFDFSKYFEAMPDSELVAVPIEMAPPREDGLDICVSNVEGYNYPISARQDKIFDYSVRGFDLLWINDNNWDIVIPASETRLENRDCSVRYDDVKEEITFEFKNIFNTSLILTQIFDKKFRDKTLAHPKRTHVDSNGNITITFDKDPDRTAEKLIRDLIILARQTSSSQQQLKVVSQNSSIVLENIDYEFGFYKVYNKVEGGYVEVWVDDIIHNKEKQTTTINLVSPSIDVVLVVWEKAVSALNKIQVDGDLTDFKNGHVYGIGHKDNYLPEATYGGRVAGLINRSDVGSQELICSLGGNFYSDVKGNNRYELRDNPFYDYTTGVVTSTVNNVSSSIESTNETTVIENGCISPTSWFVEPNTDIEIEYDDGELELTNSSNTSYTGNYEFLGTGYIIGDRLYSDPNSEYAVYYYGGYPSSYIAYNKDTSKFFLYGLPNFNGLKPKYDLDWSDSPKPVNIKSNDLFNTEDYYLPSPLIRATVTSKATIPEDLYYGPRLIEDLSEVSLLKGRGFNCTYKGNNAVDSLGYLSILSSDLLYNKTSKELIFTFGGDYNVVRGWDDSTDTELSALFIPEDIIEIKDSGSSELDGRHKVSNFDVSTNRLSIKIETAGSSFSLDKVKTGIKLGCFTTDVIVVENTLGVGDTIDPKLFSQDNLVVVIDVEKLEETNPLGQHYVRIVLDNSRKVVAIPTGLTLSGRSITNVLYFDSIYNVVVSDMIELEGGKIPLKIKSIETMDIVAGNPDLVRVTLDTKVEVSDPIINKLEIYKVGRWNPMLGPVDTLDDFQLLDQYGYSYQESINMEIIKDIILVDNYANTTKKYDGDKIYRAGLPNWRPIYNVYEDTNAKNKLSVQKIDGEFIKVEVGENDSIRFRSYKMNLAGGESWESYIGRELGFLRTIEGDIHVKGDPVEFIVDYPTASTNVSLSAIDPTSIQVLREDITSDPVYEDPISINVGDYITVVDGGGDYFSGTVVNTNNALLGQHDFGLFYTFDASTMKKNGLSISNIQTDFVEKDYAIGNGEKIQIYKGEYIEKPTEEVITKKVLTSVIPQTISNVEGFTPYVELRFEEMTQATLDELNIDHSGDDSLIDFSSEFGVTYIGMPQTYNYMARLYSTDSQGNKIISRNCGYGDYSIDQTFDSAIAVQLKIPDDLLSKRNNGNWEIELVRTKADAPNVYYFITARKLSTIEGDRLIIYDAQSDGALLQGDLDSISGFVGQGDTLATLIDGPAKSLHSTTSNNRYIQANIQSEEMAEITILTELTDAGFSYSRLADTGRIVYNSRINESELKIIGQSYIDKYGDTISLEYVFKPQMITQNSSSIVDVANATIALPSDIPDRVNFEIPSELWDTQNYGDTRDVVGCTIHYPRFRDGEDNNFSGVSTRLGQLQGTVQCRAVRGSSVVFITVDGLRRNTGITDEDLENSRGFFLGIHTKSTVDDVTTYTYGVPCYPAAFVKDEDKNVEYAGQLFDPKSRKYKNSLGQLTGSQMTDVQEYIYHLQEVMDRAGRVVDIDNLIGGDKDEYYDSFPFYVNRDATDKFKIRISPKTDDISGYSFQWKNGVQTLLSYKGLIINSDGVLSSANRFERKVFPSRVILSAENYPEVFDNPYIDNTTDEAIAIGSSSAIDVNADDGQEITGIKTFLSESLFSAASLDSILLVFKSTSVYALDLNTKKVSKIETSGVGCNIPDSIQSTSVGITFANDDGVYVITRNLDMQYLGRPLEGIWSSQVDTSVVSKVSSFNNTKNREFYISVPTVNGEHYTLSYDYALTGVVTQIRQEGWTIFDGYVPSVWAKTNKNYYYGSYYGVVFEDRDSGEATDYRDDESGISAVLEYAPTSFGDSGTRASLSKVISHFDYSTEISGLKIAISTDTNREFKHCGTVNIVDNGNRTRSIKVRPVESRGLYFQVRYEHATIDQSFKLTGIDYKAKQTSDELIEEADE